MKKLVVGREVVIDVRLEPQNSSRNPVVELTAKEIVWGKKKNKARDNQISPKEPSDPRSLVLAVSSLSPKKALVAQSKEHHGSVRFFCITLMMYDESLQSVRESKGVKIAKHHSLFTS